MKVCSVCGVSLSGRGSVLRAGGSETCLTCVEEVCPHCEIDHGDAKNCVQASDERRRAESEVESGGNFMGDTNETIERLLRDQKPWAACDIAKARIAELERGAERDERIVDLRRRVAELEVKWNASGYKHDLDSKDKRIAELEASVIKACRTAGERTKLIREARERIAELKAQIKLNVDYAKRVAELETRLTPRRLPRMDDGQSWDPR